MVDRMVDRPTLAPWVWVVASISACITSAVFILLYRWVGNRTREGHKSASSRIWGLAVYLLWSFVAVGVLGALGLLGVRGCRPALLERFRREVRVEPGLGWVAVGIGALVVCTQLGILVSVNACVNPGYAHMVINLNVLLVLLGAYLIFGIPVSGTSGVGVGVAMAGVILVICGQRQARRL